MKRYSTTYYFFNDNVSNSWTFHTW